MNTYAPAVEFRLPWRHHVLGIVGAVLFLLGAAVQLWIDRAFGVANPNINVLVAMHCLPAAISAALGLLPFRWRLRVDQEGIWVRRISRWALWSWDDFASGQLRHGCGDRNVFDPRASRRHCRVLALDLLAEADRERVWRWIELVWRPLRPPLPDEIEVQQNLSTMKFDAAGVHVLRGRKAFFCRWDDVESLEIDRLRHGRNDFRGLRLKLSDRTVCFGRDGSNQRLWRGADAEVLARYLIARVGENRQLICAVLDPPRTLREAQARAQRAQKRLRATKKLRSIFGACSLGLSKWCAFAWDPVSLMLLVVSLVNYETITLLMYRPAVKESEKYLQWQNELAAVPEDAANCGFL